MSERVDAVLARMTLPDKIGQLNFPLPLPPDVVLLMGRPHPATAEDCERLAAGTFHPALGPVGGLFGAAVAVVDGGPADQAAFHNHLQTIAARSGPRIPLLQIDEGLHGLKARGATIFPEGPALGATFDPDLVGAVFAAAGREARAIGVHVLDVIVEPIRDPRLGRNSETFTECPWLTTTITTALTAAMQGDDLTSLAHAGVSLCHFPGQSAPVSGLERGAMEISDRTLRQVFLPPFAAALRPGGAVMTMATYPAIDGVPVHKSVRILTRLLRDELGFEGVVLSEGNGLETLVYEGTATDQAAAGLAVLQAGVDVSITWEDGYLDDLAAAAAEPEVAALVDRAVRRVLAVKERFGLLDPDPVLPDPARAAAILGSADHRALSRQAAQAGIVLLKNNHGVLPLPADARVAVAGPLADNARTLLGDYVVPAAADQVESVLAVLRRRLPGLLADPAAVAGTTTDLDDATIAAAVAQAADADVALLVLGEQSGDFLEEAVGLAEFEAQVGERYDSATLELPGRQAALFAAVAATGTPVVVVLLHGRALAVPDLAERAAGIVDAWIPGQDGADAVVDVLTGVVNPSGRCPVSFPRHAGQLPVTYDMAPSKRYAMKEVGYVDLNPRPVYAFGHGLSYTTFGYSPPRLTTIGDGAWRVEVDITNTGGRAGHEVAQLYVTDVLSSVVTPVQVLRGIARVFLEPGATTTVTFPVHAVDLALLDEHLQPLVEPGAFSLAVAAASDDPRGTVTLTLDAAQADRATASITHGAVAGFTEGRAGR